MESTISQIKQQNEMTSVAGRYIRLTRQGRVQVGLCPFHDDHHPSLQIDPERQSYICYACGAKGDVITFVQEIEKCTFSEALKKLTGPRSPHPASPQGGGVREKKVKEAPPLGELRGLLGLLLPYYTNVPGLTSTYLDFGTGLAPSSLSGSWKAMAGRLIFPVHDEEGTLVGYAGRSLIPPSGGGEAVVGALPKYLNTPGLPRGRILYGLHRAKSAIRQEGVVYVVEGFKDVLAMHAAGLTATVGLCGTQLADGQKELLCRYAGKVVLVLDGDAAGRAAAQKIASLLEAAGKEVFTIPLPENADPDSLFREWGASRLAAYIHRCVRAPPPEETLLVAALLRWPVVRETAAGEVVSWITLVPGILRDEELNFESEAYQNRLDEYACSGESAGLASPVADPPCEEELNRRITAKQQAGLPGEAAKAALLRELFIAYCEARLIRLIQTLTRNLTAVSSPHLRRQQLNELTRRRTQLTAVSELLGTAGAVFY